MSNPTGSTLGGWQSGAPAMGINAPLDAPKHTNRPPAVNTGQPIIEITCSSCGELTSRTYPIEINGEPVPSAPNEKYPCSCPSPL